MNKTEWGTGEISVKGDQVLWEERQEVVVQEGDTEV